MYSFLDSTFFDPFFNPPPSEEELEAMKEEAFYMLQILRNETYRGRRK